MLRYKVKVVLPEPWVAADRQIGQEAHESFDTLTAFGLSLVPCTSHRKKRSDQFFS